LRTHDRQATARNPSRPCDLKTWCDLNIWRESWARATDDQDVDVVAITDQTDLHWTAVCDQLRLAQRTVLRFNLADLRSIGFTAHMDRLRIQIGQNCHTISRKTCVWWRWAGRVDTIDLDDQEASLACDESPHLLIGAMEEVGARIVDHPFVVARAETKELQLAIARRLGFSVPATLVTNEPDVARAFAANRKIVAKAVSSGVGIAPYVAEVFDSDLDAVRTLPTMLQELVSASADLRVVVVGDDYWGWRRPREAGMVDWRQTDPGGSGFVPVANQDLGTAACEITSALGLSISVQDWLEADGDLIFLESNAHGAWLFLSGSQEKVAPAIARHLRARHD
jgi:hypothetical protein